MTELLEQAIARVRQLPEEEQDLAADFLSALVARRLPPERVDEQTRAAIQEGIAQADGQEFVSDEEMAAFFARHGA